MKKILLALLLLACPSIALGQGMVSQVAGNGANLATGNTRYLPLSASGGNWNGTLGAVDVPMPISATFSNLRTKLSATSGTGSRQFTFVVNTVATALDTTITNGTANADSSNSIATVPGDLVAMRQITTGTLDSVITYWSMKVVAANPNEQAWLMAVPNTLGAGTTRYYQPMGSSAGGNADETLAYARAPTAGVLSAMYVKSRLATDSSGITVMLRINTADTALTTTITSGNTTANDLSHSVSVSAGDLIAIRAVNNGTIATAIGIGMKFAPTINGESAMMNGNINSLSQNTTAYMPPGGAYTQSDSSAESMGSVLCQTGSFKKIYGSTVANVGGTAQTMTARLRKGGVNTALLAAVATGTRVNSETATTIDCAEDDLMSISLINSATTGTTTPTTSIVYYVAPVTATHRTGTTLGVGQ